MDETDRKQRIRIARFRIAGVSYLLWFGFGMYAFAIGQVGGAIGPVPFPPWLLLAAVIMSNAVFWVIFSTGFNFRFKDPSLTMGQSLTACTWAILFSGMLTGDKGISLVIFVMVFMFGVFNLSRSQFTILWAYSVTGYALVTWLDVTQRPDGDLGVQLMNILALALVLFWVALFGYYIGQLRSKLAIRNSELRKALAMLEQLTVRDDLTGAHNRRYVMEAMEREVKRAERGDYGFALLILDIDRFKSVNDTFGHLVGDAVLKGVVRRLREQVRAMDLIGKTGEFGRFGGEEFLVLLPESTLDGAVRSGERIRNSIAREPFDYRGKKVPITVSIGAAEYHKGEPLRSLLERADAALYAAKSAGRDQVCSRTQPLVDED